MYTVLLICFILACFVVVRIGDIIHAGDGLIVYATEEASETVFQPKVTERLTTTSLDMTRG